MDVIRNSFIEAENLLKGFVKNPNNWRLLEKAGSIMVQSIQEGGKIISCGNGGSMCDAMHFAEELTGRFRRNRKPIPAIAISDPSHITCTANDYGFNEIFSRYIEALGNEGDVLFAISTSGNSENVINAACMALENQMKVIGLTGKDGGKLAELCDVEIRIPHFNYADRIQEMHIKIIHSLIHYIELNII